MYEHQEVADGKFYEIEVENKDDHQYHHKYVCAVAVIHHIPCTRYSVHN